MTVQSCAAFLQHAGTDPDLAELMRAMTDPDELVALGNRRGYRFGAHDLVNASSIQPGRDDPPPEPSAATGPEAPAAGGATTIYHYELDLLGIPEMQPIVNELPNLKIKPATVDLERFATAFRSEDLEWTNTSPAASGFRVHYEDTMASHWSGAAGRRRDFHLVNLDRHVHHPAYESYLQAKVRMVRHLSRLLGYEIRLSGSMWYPPHSYRLWHTNENQPGWRMYLIDFDTSIPDADTRSFFRYMNPATKRLVTLPDRPKMLRFFKIDQAADNLFWHCIVNRANRNRWSFGFAIPDDWMTRLGGSLPPGLLDNRRP